jgi:hypothetical protein
MNPALSNVGPGGEFFSEAISPEAVYSAGPMLSIREGVW